VTSLFTRDGAHYLPGDWARGPWHPELLHGGPVAALLAHGVVGARDDDGLQVARLTIDLFRPVPFGPLALAVETVRGGKRIKLVDAFLSAAGEVVARASGLMLRRGESGPGATTLPETMAIAPWQGLAPRNMGKGDEPRFHRSVEMRRLNEPFQGKLFATWARVPLPFLPQQPLAPVEHVAALADFTGAFGQNSRAGRLGLINADITLHLHRDPIGEWICLECIGRGDEAGLAASSVNLHDEQGLIGHSLSSSLANDFRR
jgi:hypothetical protein